MKRGCLTIPEKIKKNENEKKIASSVDPDDMIWIMPAIYSVSTLLSRLFSGL